MCDNYARDREDPEREAVYEDFKATLGQQLNSVYGTDVNHLESSRKLCLALRLDLLPEDLDATRTVSPVKLTSFPGTIEGQCCKNTDRNGAEYLQALMVAEHFLRLAEVSEIGCKL